MSTDVTATVASRSVIAGCVQGMIAIIMVRALHKDFSRYNRVATDEEKAEDREETGWKLVHADVFRPPARMPLLFAVFTGACMRAYVRASLTPRAGRDYWQCPRQARCPSSSSFLPLVLPIPFSSLRSNLSSTCVTAHDTQLCLQCRINFLP